MFERSLAEQTKLVATCLAGNIAQATYPSTDVNIRYGVFKKDIVEIVRRTRRLIDPVLMQDSKGASRYASAFKFLFVYTSSRYGIRTRTDVDNSYILDVLKTSTICDGLDKAFTPQVCRMVSDFLLFVRPYKPNLKVNWLCSRLAEKAVNFSPEEKQTLELYNYFFEVLNHISGLGSVGFKLSNFESDIYKICKGNTASIQSLSLSYISLFGTTPNTIKFE